MSRSAGYGASPCDVLPGQLTGAQLLQNAVREAVGGSPGAFLLTADEAGRKPLGYWEQEIRSSTWVVLQRGREPAGLAAARRPWETDTGADPETARFIESVWVSPGLRGHHIGERLLRFLCAAECEKNPAVSLFLLWVFAENRSAVRLYERMKFRYSGISHVEGGRAALQYRLESAAVLAGGEAGGQGDLRDFGVSYRILT